MIEELTPKARQTRAHILETALALFAEKGYANTTLREIATAADVSLGLTYRYFARKEELIFTLYQRLAEELQADADNLPVSPVAERFGRTISGCLARLSPHREALGALFAVGLAPDSETAVLGEASAGVRDTVWHTYHTVIAGASDAPRTRQQSELTTAFYALHLMLVLYWLQDRTPGQSSTRELIAFTRDSLSRLRPLLGLPPVAQMLKKLVTIITPLFGPAK